MKMRGSWLAVSLLSSLLWLWADNAAASKDYTVVVDNQTDITTTLTKTASHCMYSDGPGTISVDPLKSTTFTMTDDDGGLECWGARKTVSWKFSNPADGGAFHFEHAKEGGSWISGFWSDVGGRLQMTVWCGTKANPQQAQCFGHSVDGGYDYFTISYKPKGANVVAMRFQQGAKGDLTLKRVSSANMADPGRDQTDFTKEEDFYIQKAAGNSDSIVKWQVSNSAGSTVLHYVNSYDGKQWSTQILVDANPPTNAPRVAQAMCDGRDCLTKKADGIPEEISIDFGIQ